MDQAKRSTAGSTSASPLVLLSQGSFAVGGSIVRTDGDYTTGLPPAAGQTLHGDHAYAFYQIPIEPRPYPLVFVHGNSQSARTWETTPDGREGFQNLFLRRGFSVYCVDQPRRGKSGQSTVPFELTATPSDQFWFNTLRLGVWPDFFPGVQFCTSAECLEQFLRQMTPTTGPFDLAVAADGISAVADKVGPCVLVTHSQGGGIGWSTVLRTENVRGIVCYEPGSNFPFPEGEAPSEMPSAGGPLAAMEVPLDEFLKFTRIPIVIFFGDFIPSEPVENHGQDQWRVRAAMARLWADAVNRRGGHVEIVDLPSIGVRGNTHFPFSDLNNVEIADLMSAFLSRNGLD
jgi:pimeloyl-ACP methyl ester carboxylesterase